MLVYIIFTLIISAIAIYVIFLYKGKIKDTDKDFIPDVIEESITDVNKRISRVKDEMKDVKKAAKDLVDQIGDVPKAAGKRKGRKPKK
mgnify:FL=1